MKKKKKKRLARRRTPPTTPPAIPPFAAAESPSLVEVVAVSVGVGTTPLGTAVWEGRVEDSADVTDAVEVGDVEKEVDVAED